MYEVKLHMGINMNYNELLLNEINLFTVSNYLLCKNIEISHNIYIVLNSVFLKLCGLGDLKISTFGNTEEIIKDNLIYGMSFNYQMVSVYSIDNVIDLYVYDRQSKETTVYKNVNVNLILDVLYGLLLHTLLLNDYSYMLSNNRKYDTNLIYFNFKEHLYDFDYYEFMSNPLYVLLSTVTDNNILRHMRTRKYEITIIDGYYNRNILLNHHKLKDMGL